MPKVSHSKQPNKGRSGSAVTSSNKELHQMKILLDVSKQIAKFDRLDDMLKAIVEIIARETGAERGSLYLNRGIRTPGYGLFSKRIFYNYG